MEKFNVALAGLTVEVNCHYAFTKEYCRAYLTDAPADFAVTVTDEHIDQEVAISPYHPQRDYAESICVYREIANRLPLYHRAVFHGAVISYRGKGYLFTAPSGTGKTTHIRLWRKYLDGVDIVNGDKPILRVENGEAEAYATPYAGKERYENHGSILLSGICYLRRGEENRIRRVTTGEILRDIVKQLYIPKEAQAVAGTLDLLDGLMRSVPVYVLECNISEDAVKTSFEALTGEKYKP
ncbi:MAG: hypothetical protein IJ168_00090 [Eubacterium sp.]|nr:hypothetical protein [Eubacterium sp.]